MSSLPLTAQLESLSQSTLLGSPIETDPVPLGLSSSKGSGSLDLESEQLGTLTGGSLKEPPLYPLPYAPQSAKLPLAPGLRSSPALLPTAMQPPPPMSRMAQVGFPGTHSCNNLG
ncbi:uncharacterized protein EI90DRAFT_3114574 [Cantharellus anzutake]|uniref:uncharacterized protein n=1 Tax=Cantharellus anzutake TaxID=1750568 RepID=UPI0019050EC3|nr:uncharacterized protein EI90DRAFT_3114574 [Cantharellus anzutake]KAF8343924.1 hypothetical protein EI90DRAFT_3114574 [Cantharellus anzutake]